MKNTQYLQKLASFLTVFAAGDDEKKLKLLKMLDSLSREDADFEKIKIELFNTDPEIWAPLFGTVKKNPSISLSAFVSEKEKIIAEKNKKEQGKALKYTNEEQEAVKDISNNTIKDWALKALKDSEVLRKEPNKVQEVVQSLNVIIHFKEENNVDLHSKYPGKNGFESAFKDAREWEESFKHTSSVAYKTNEVVWSEGPWKIVEIKGEEEDVKNDLSLEGQIMSHCVGGYAHQVMQGSSRIFSLRDGGNRPHATIETDSGIFSFRQVFGPRNSELDSEKYSIIKKWQNKLHPKEKIISLANSQNVKDKINAVLFIDFNDLDYGTLFDKLFNDNSKTNRDQGFHNETTAVIEALAENETLSEEKYNLIFEKGKKNNKVLFKLVRNTKISLELFKHIYDNTVDDYVLKAVASSRKLKDTPEIIVKLFGLNTEIKQMLLNNPSVPSRPCVEFLIKNDLAIIETFRETANFEPKFIDDIITAAKILNTDISLNVIKALKQNVYKINKENLFKLFNVKKIQYDKSKNVNELLNLLIIKKYNLTNEYEAEYLAVNSEDDLALDESTPAQILLELSKNENDSIRSYVAQNTSTPAEALLELSKVDSSRIKSNVAKNISTPPQALLELSKDKDNYIRGFVASNTSTPSDALILLTTDPWSRPYLAENPSSPAVVLSYLDKFNGAEENPYNKWLSKNLSTPPEILSKLSKDKDYNIRKNVAGNISTPPEILSELSKDLDMAATVAGNISTPPQVLLELLSKGEDFIKKHVAKNPSTPPQALLELSKIDQNLNVRMNVAINKSTPHEILLQLRKSENIFIVSNLAENPSTPPDMLLELSKYPDSDVRWTVSENPSAPPEALLELSKATDKNDIKINVAKHLSTPVHILLELSKHTDEKIKLNAIRTLMKLNKKTAGYTNTLTKIAQELQDADRIVQELLGGGISGGGPALQEEKIAPASIEKYQLPVRVGQGGSSIDEGDKPWIVGHFAPGVNLNSTHRNGHSGVDQKSVYGSPIYPIASGIVLDAGVGAKSGNYVKVSHEDGKVTSFYGHMSKIIASKGQKVSQSSVLGEVGTSGNAAGTGGSANVNGKVTNLGHVHFEVKVNGSLINPLNIIGKPVGSLSKKAELLNKIEKLSNHFISLLNI